MRRLGMVALWLAVGCVRQLPPTMTPAETVTWSTWDGWQGEIRHFPGDGPPVLLVHGMAANHFNFDYREEVSLAAWLQARDWDVWVPALRGDPNTSGPRRRDRRKVTFDDHARRDLPAIVQTVLDRTGRDDLFWVGHSMGGMLLYTALALYPDAIRAGVAICSPATFQHPTGLHRMLRGLGMARRGPRLPARGFGRFTSGLGLRNPLVRRIGNPENLDRRDVAGLARHALNDVSRGVAREAVGWMRAGELVQPDGSPWMVADPTPMLVIGAAGDRVAPEPDVAWACEVLPVCTYIRLSVQDGFSFDYGHVDPVVGISAPTEVYSLVGAFLDARRPLANPSPSPNSGP